MPDDLCDLTTDDKALLLLREAEYRGLPGDEKAAFREALARSMIAKRQGVDESPILLAFFKQASTYDRLRGPTF